MKDEIKEILDNIRKTADNSVFVICSSQEELDKIPKYTSNFLSLNDRQSKLLIDYITNLQEELEKTRLENKVLKEQMVAMVQPNYVYGIELQGVGKDEN